MGLPELLQNKRDEILRIAAKHGACNVRVFGSVARGQADSQSDIDLLVEMEPGRSLLDLGNTVIVIEHNLDVIKQADWIIDLGPEGGEAGGTLVAQGTPEEIARAPQSFTGQYLKTVLAPGEEVPS
jgi:predicted nucleotidyltransferase